VVMDQDISSKLQRFILSDKEEGGLVLSVDDIAIGMQDCSLSLIGKIFGEKNVNFSGLKTTISSIWVTDKPFSIRNLGNNKFQFLFQFEQDRDRILEGKTWNFDGQYLLLKPWNSENNEFSEEDEIIKIWVQILNLPLHWLSADTGVKLGRMLGKVLDVQVPGIGNYHGQNMNILVQLPLSEPILRGTFIKMGEDNKWVDFRYENIQSFCFYCGIIGHSDRSCVKKNTDIDNNELQLGQYGEWLRIGSSPNSSYRSFSGVNLGSQASTEATIPTPTHPIAKSVVGDKCSSGNIHSPSPSSNAVKGKTNLEGEGSENPNLSKVVLVSDSLTQKPSILNKEPEVHVDANLVEVNVQASTSGRRIVHRKKTASTKEVSTSRLVAPEQMHIDEPNVSKKGLGKGNNKRTNEVNKKKKKKKKKKFVESVCKKLKLVDNWFYLKPVGYKGGLFLYWSDKIMVLDIIPSDFGLEVKFSFAGNSDVFWGIFIYASTSREIRSSQWEVIIRHSLYWGSSWFICGDFNDIIDHSEKLGGIRREESSFLDFRNLISCLGVSEANVIGHPFTWTNNRKGDQAIEEKLDRFLFSQNWLDLFPNSLIKIIPVASSDHSILLFDSNPGCEGRKNRFVFDARWLKSEGFNDIVVEAWNFIVPGHALFSIQQRLKNVRNAIIKWKKRVRGNARCKIEECRVKLESLRALGGDRDWSEWNRCKIESQLAYESEELFWRQKSRITWLREGDKNSKFFHACVNQRRKSNSLDNIVKADGSRYDSLLFCKADLKHAFLVFDILAKYGCESGQAVNFDKSSILFSKNTSEGTQAQICGILSSINRVKSSRYLGLPLGIGRSKKETFKFVSDCVRNKILSWKNKFLSDSGREIMIKAVLSALPTY
ncbi:Unknown protein, partial [Striga hermonthica]